MSHEDMRLLARGLAPAVHDCVTKALSPIEERLGELERRLAEAETRGLAYRGIWQRACGYKRGDVTTHASSAWVCLRDVEAGEAPGKSDQWQLMAKGSR